MKKRIIVLTFLFLVVSLLSQAVCSAEIGTVSLGGVFYNNGTVGTVNLGTGLVNSGKIDVVNNTKESTITNSGDIGEVNNCPEGKITYEGTAPNILKNVEGGTLVIDKGKTVTVKNGQIIKNSGLIINNGTLLNNGSIENFGIITNNGIINNLGEIVDSGKIDGKGKIEGNAIVKSSHIITFNPIGGSVTPRFGETEVDGTLLALPTPVRDGYTFNGWYTEKNGGKQITKNTIFSCNTTVYAQWARVKNNEAIPSPINKPTTGSAPNLNKANDWARGGIADAFVKGIIPNDLQDNYTDTITRAEFCRLAVRWLVYRLDITIDALLDLKGLARSPDAFTDTDDPDILAAFALGITSGTGYGLFNPDGQFSREQAATMIRNMCKAAGMDISNVSSAGFEDIGDASDWAIDSINFCRNNGIMNGTSISPLLFSPKDSYTREQSIITLNNIN